MLFARPGCSGSQQDFLKPVNAALEVPIPLDVEDGALSHLTRQRGILQEFAGSARDTRRLGIDQETVNPILNSFANAAFRDANYR
jgi:hypothetical protein